MSAFQMITDGSPLGNDIFYTIFQYLTIKEIYSLSSLSSFFYKFILNLKKQYTNPVYEIVILSNDKSQLQNFTKKLFPNHIFKIPIENHNFASETISHEFIFKEKRYHLQFHMHFSNFIGSIGKDDFKSVEGFLFLKSKFFYNLPFCKFVNGILLIDEDYENLNDLFFKNENLKNKENKILQKYGIPCNNLGTFTINLNEKNKSYLTLMECINILVENSNNSFLLNYKMNNQVNNQINNKEEMKENINLMEWILKIIDNKTTTQQVDQLITKITKNQFNLFTCTLAESESSIFFKKIGFIHFPFDIQFKLITKLYNAIIEMEPSVKNIKNQKLIIKKERIKKLDFISVTFLQMGQEEIDYEKYQMWKRRVNISFSLVDGNDVVKFSYDELGEVNDEEEGKKCLLQ
ncbi:hypothetical protein ABK040_007995 [Willaertia magna]